MLWRYGWTIGNWSSLFLLVRVSQAGLQTELIWVFCLVSQPNLKQRAMPSNMQGNSSRSSPKSTVLVDHFFDPQSSTFSYLVQDPNSAHCAVIDSVLGFDQPSGTVCYELADEIIGVIKQRKLVLQYLIETHVHADHLSAAPYIQSVLGGKLMMSHRIVEVQEEFGRLFNEGSEFERDGSQFDVLLEDDARYQLGEVECTALATPGHTPACMTHVIGDAAFVGDTLFMPDSGTARADFPGGSAAVLYRSIQRVLALPESTRLFMCHDYQPEGRELRFETTVAEQKAQNIHVGKGRKEDDFVALRTARDKTLGMPSLILPSLQVNMRAGHFPAQESNGSVYLKLPVSGIRQR